MKKQNTYKITIKTKDGNEKVFEHVAEYRHDQGYLEIREENGAVERVPVQEIKHSYIGAINEENRIQRLNS